MGTVLFLSSGCDRRKTGEVEARNKEITYIQWSSWRQRRASQSACWQTRFQNQRQSCRREWSRGQWDSASPYWDLWYSHLWPMCWMVQMALWSLPPKFGASHRLPHCSVRCCRWSTKCRQTSGRTGWTPESTELAWRLHIPGSDLVCEQLVQVEEDGPLSVRWTMYLYPVKEIGTAVRLLIGRVLLLRHH